MSNRCDCNQRNHDENCAIFSEPVFLAPSSYTDHIGRVVINSERTYYGQTERLLSGDSHYPMLETEDKIRRLHGIPSIFA